MTSKYHFTYSDIVLALKEGGLKKGDNIWVFSSLGFLGRPQNAKNIEDVCKLFHSAIREVIGKEGTIFVPTYSYTIGKNLASEPVIFDPEKEPAQIGPFPEYFRKLPSVVRSNDPMMPIAGKGPLAEKVLKEVPPNSYGHDSVYERLLEYQVKILTLGLGPNWIPFIHYLDWLHKVPFRFDKLFTGGVKKNKKIEYVNWIYPVRTLIEESYPWTYRAGEIAKKKGICKFSPLGKSGFYICDYTKYLLEIYHIMEKDKWFLAKQPKVNVFQKELERIKGRSKKLIFPNFEPKKWLKILENQRRDLISLSTDAVLEALKEHFKEFEIKEIPTGEYCLSWIVPERWSLYEAKLINPETGEVLADASKNPASVYSYSKPFEGEVDKKRLLKHITTDLFLPNARSIVNVVLDRDWGFALTKEELTRLTAKRYYVKLKTDYSLGKLRWLEAVVEGKSDREICLVTFIDGPYKVNEHLSGVIALLELLQWAKDNKLKYTLRFIITVSGIGLPCWIEKNKKIFQKVEAILLLTSLGRGEIFTMQLNSLKNLLIGKMIENLNEEKKAYQLLTEGFYRVFSFGGNPFVYYPKKEELKEKIKQLEEKFGIKGRKDFLHTAEELFELELPQKIVVFGRAMPANTLFFPFKGKGTDLDASSLIDWEQWEESVMFLKKVLLSL